MSKNIDNKQNLDEVQAEVAEKLNNPPVMSIEEATEELKRQYNDNQATTWKVNGHELEFDMADYETSTKYFEAVKLMGAKEKQVSAALQNNTHTPEVIKLYCDIYHTFIDALFGDGTAMKIFDGKYNVHKAMKAYDDLLDLVAAQSDRTVNIINFRSSKFNAKRAKRNTKNKKR